MVNGVSGGVEKHRRRTEAQDRRGKQKSRSVAHIVDLHINRAIVAAAAAEPVRERARSEMFETRKRGADRGELFGTCARSAERAKANFARRRFG